MLLFVEVIFPEDRARPDLDNFLFRFFIYPIGYVSVGRANNHVAQWLSTLVIDELSLIKACKNNEVLFRDHKV